MRGCFKVAAIGTYPDPLDKKWKMDSKRQVGVYIPKSHILHIEKFEDQNEHEIDGKTFPECRFNGTYHYTQALFECVDDVYDAWKTECTCGVGKYLQLCEERNIPKHEPDNGCYCKLSVYPLYEITVHNYTQVCVKMSNNSQTAPFMERIPPTVTYLVHPSEHEHLERYLAGRDDPMYEFLQQLPFMPPFGGGEEYQAARGRWENSKKRARFIGADE
jgi:hypothetical protein